MATLLRKDALPDRMLEGYGVQDYTVDLRSSHYSEIPP